MFHTRGFNTDVGHTKDKTKKSQSCIVVYPENGATISRSKYYCGKQFLVEDVLPLFENRESLSQPRRIGIVLVSGKCSEVHVFTPNDTTNQNPNKMQTGVLSRTGGRLKTTQAKKQRKGGQSAQRFCRIRHEKRGLWVKKVHESLDAAFLDADSQPTIAGLVIAGPSTLKYEVLGGVQERSWGKTSCSSRLLTLLAQRKLVHAFATPEIETDSTKASAIDKVRTALPDIFGAAERQNEQEAWCTFEHAMDTDSAFYGVDSVREGLQQCAVKELLVSSSLSRELLDELDRMCVQAGATMTIFISEPITRALKTYNGVVGLAWFSSSTAEDI